MRTTQAQLLCDPDQRIHMRRLPAVRQRLQEEDIHSGTRREADSHEQWDLQSRLSGVQGCLPDQGDHGDSPRVPAVEETRTHKDGEEGREVKRCTT